MDNKDSQKNEVWFPTPQLLKEDEQLLTTGTRISPESKSEPFSFQKNTFEKGLALPSVEVPLFELEVNRRNRSDLKRKQEISFLSTRECVTKRHRLEEDEQEEANALSHPSNLCTSQTVEDDCNYMCPLDDVNRDDLKNLTISDIHSDPESSCVGTHEIAGGKEKRGVPRPYLYVPYKYDMKEEEMETENNMWKLRSNRVQQILFSLDEYCTLKISRRIGLEYNVGFGPKQHFSIHSLSNFMLLEIAKFAVAMNSSHKDFIMEILEYNYDFGQWSEDQRKSFTSKLMNRVRKLNNCEDAVKLSKEAFELPDFVSSVNMANQSMGFVNPEFSCTSSATESDVAPTCSSDPHDETKEHRVDLYPFCKDIGLKLNVISSQENKKLDINKLTNGAMTEVTNFAEKLCGTFDEICQDILRHNFDLDQSNGDSDLAKMIPAQIPFMLEHTRLVTCTPSSKKKYTITDLLAVAAMDCPKNTNLDEHNNKNLMDSKEMKHTVEDLPSTKKDCQSNSNLDTCTGFSQTPINTPNVGRPANTKIDNEANLLLWTLRQTQIRQILTVPHGEHCPFYSFSRCKKLGIDFNVGSGIKQDLDPTKFLTNGIMLEMTVLAAALYSAQKDFITEILEYNFDLNLNNEVIRGAFAQVIFQKIGSYTVIPKESLKDKPIKLPDPSSIDQSAYPKGKYCPKCNQDRKSKLVQDPSDHPHSMTDTVLVEANSSAQKSAKDLSTAFHAAEEKIRNSNPRCKTIGLSLCVNKDKPKRKLDLRVLTRRVMREIVSFAKRLCGTKNKVMNDILEHNFNFGIFQRQNFNHAFKFHQVVRQNAKRGPMWFNYIVDMFSWPYVNSSNVVKQSEICTAEQNEKKGTTKTKKLAMHTKNAESSEKDLLLMKKDCQNNPHLDTCSTGFSQTPIKSQTVGSSAHIEQGDELDLLLWTKDVTKWREDSAIQKNERKEMTKKRRLALLTKREETAMLREDTGAVKAKKCKQSSGYYHPISKGMGLDLDLENPTSTGTGTGNHQSFITSIGGSSSLQSVKFNVDPSFVTQSNERELFGTEEKTEIQENVSYKFDMEEEEMEKESNMWKLRINRVQQILFSLDKYCIFKRSRRLGRGYNVGFGPKQNLSADLLNTSTLFEIAKFALAMNSSQEDFIMEILEYNFDFGQWSEHQRKGFASELMNRLRKLKNCEDAVKLSKETFELPDFVSTVNMVNQSMSIFNPEFSCTSSATESDVAPTCSSDPHDETKEQRVDLYPFCKDIGLKLNVISSQENKKLDINKLTNGAMTEVTNFAEKLCGTFDQICQDILRHNFDLDQPNGDFDLARSIVAQIPVILEHTRLAAFLKRKLVVDVSAMAMSCWKNPDLDAQNRLNLTSSEDIKHTIQNLPAMKKDCQNNSNLDACSTGFSQAPITSPNAGCSTDIEQDNEPNLLLWTLRETQIRQILSVPHLEHCPFYSYSRCKKLGIDFNVGSGIKQNFDPSEFLTNGILLEIITLVDTLNLSHKEFVTEILEYNFHLDLKNEVCRSVFAYHTFDKARRVVQSPKIKSHLNMPFELPDTRSMDQSVLPKSIYCPKCYQDRKSKLDQDPSEPINELRHHSYAMTDTVLAEAKSSAQKSTKDLSTAFQAEEEKIMNSYPRCKKIGLSLCVNKDKPKRKLELHVLTHGVMREVFYFAKKLCGKRIKVTGDVLEHSFNINIQSLEIDPVARLRKMSQLHNGPTWFNDIVLLQSKRGPRDNSKDDSAVQKYERKETLEKRKLALRTKKEEAAKLTDLSAAVKVRTCQQLSAEKFPLCSEIGLDLDVTSKSEKKEKLDLKLLTTAVVMEIYTFLKKKPRHYYPSTLYDILDYNFDISSQNHRRWEFSIAAYSEIKTIAKTYLKNLHIANEVFKLPFLLEHKASNEERKNSKVCVEEAEKTKNKEGKAAQKLKNHSDAKHTCFVDVQTNMQVKDKAYNSVQERQNKETSDQKKTSFQQFGNHLPVSHVDFLDVKTYKVLWMSDVLWMNGGTASPKHSGTIMQETQSPVRHVCHGPLQEIIQVKVGEDDSHYSVVKPEPVTSPQAEMTVQQVKCFSDVSNVSLVDAQCNTEVLFHEEDIKPQIYPDTIKQETESPVSGVCDGPLQDVQVKEDEDESYHVAVKPEPVTVNISEPVGNLLTMCPPSENNIKTESETKETRYYSLARPQVSEGYGVLAVCPNTESSVKNESDTEDVKFEIPL